MPRSPLAPLVVLFAATLAAQTVHVVGPGGFAQIQQAIAAASAGDVVEIQSGAYAAFTLAKNLTVTAAPGAVVDVISLPMFPANLTVFQPPALARVSGLRFRIDLFGLGSCQVQVLGGTVHFADCAFESTRFTRPPTPGLRVQNARVAMQRCVVIGGTTWGVGVAAGSGCDGLRAVNATVAATDCLFLGGALSFDFTGRAGHGVLAEASDVHLANCIAVGGDNSNLNGTWPPGDGVHVATTSRLWLADCQLRGGIGHSHTGGGGLVNLGAIAAQEARSVILGGPGAPIGIAVVGPLVTAPLLGLVGPTPAITLGAPWSIGYRAAPATPVLALWSEALSPSVLPLVAEPVWLPANAFAVAGLGVTDPNGLLTFTFAVPGTPSLLHAPCFVQAFAGVTLPLEAAPPVGGPLR